MRLFRLVGLIVAVLCAGLATWMFTRPKEGPPVIVQAPAPAVPMADVLVAKADIQVGTALSPEMMAWESWPASAANDALVRRISQPDAIKEFEGAIARGQFVAGEPIRASKLVKGLGKGFLSVILTPGMRAMSVEISPETGAGGLILPNDRVDVLVARRQGEQRVTAETVMRNLRVLAIDQTFEEKNGEKVAVGKTATLEVTPAQAEILVSSRNVGTLSLALRSIVDGSPSKLDGEPEERVPGQVRIIRYGVTAQ